MSNLFYRNPRMHILFVSLILVAGTSSYYVLPRMEDPLLTERAAIINTVFPGADAERVESLVTDKLEEELRDIEEIKELRSTSRTGISTISVELRDDVYQSKTDAIWSRVRDKLGDATPNLPAGARKPDFDKIDVKAYAQIVALTWSQPQSPNYAILRRLAEDLKDQLKSIPGTEEVDLFGDPDEQVVVEIDSVQLSALGLTAEDIARKTGASDAKVAAGLLRGDRGDLLLEVSGEFDALAQIGGIPIHYGDDGTIVQLGDIATVEKGITDPPGSLAVIGGRSAVVLGVLVRSDYRIDHWSATVSTALAAFEDRLPPGIELRVVFEQNRYVETRLAGLLANLLLGGVAVVGVVLLLMGWRSAVVVGAALPLSALMVLAGMRALGIPIHQMSVTGLIIALGLLIDNAIVMVDEVSQKLRGGATPADAVSSSVRHLAVPLFGSTLTTALAFAPIALMPGPAGEFVGSIATSVLLAICSSFLLAMTVTPAMAAIVAQVGGSDRPSATQRMSKSNESKNARWWRAGLTSPKLTALYRKTLHAIFRRPAWGVGLAIVLPVAGFIQSRHLPEQFFPPADRDQFQIEVELPAHASLTETLATVMAMRDAVKTHDEVEEVDWFLGESAPSFYYNLITRRKNTSSYAQGLVQLKSPAGARELIHTLQAELDRQFPQAMTLVRQLEQGPPFDAPIEVRLFGPDADVLRALGDEIRVVLADTPQVLHSRSELTEALPKISLVVDQQQARWVGLDHAAVAGQLDATLEGATGGSVLEATEELPVRIRVSNSQRGNLDDIVSLDLMPPGLAGGDDHPGIPLTALADVELIPEVAAIPRLNGQRMNEVKAYVTAGVLPADVLADFKQRLAELELKLPAGYSLAYGGEAAKRDEAVGNLTANVGVLMVLMAATLVLSFRSFRIAALIGVVAALSAGLGLGALWLFGFPFGFMAIVGTMGLIGVAINDAIVVMAALREDRRAREGEPAAVREVIIRSTRHVVATSLTTIAGFTPLFLGGGGFWPPLAVAIAGGVGGATILALCFVPSAYILVMCRGCQATLTVPATDASISTRTSDALQPAFASQDA